MKRKMTLLLSLFLVFVMLLTACGGGGKTDDKGTETTKPTGTAEGAAGDGGAKTEMLTVCVGPDPDTIDPALNSAVDGGTLIIHAFEGLTTLDQNGVPIPAQAENGM